MSLNLETLHKQKILNPRFNKTLHCEDRTSGEYILTELVRLRSISKPNGVHLSHWIEQADFWRLTSTVDLKLCNSYYTSLVL